MSLIYSIRQEIDDEEMRQGAQQCFVGHEFNQVDLREKLEAALEQFDMSPYFADREVTGDFVLSKICRKIFVTAASIMDLTTANPNVYFELGVAIGLNKPVFLVLHKDRSISPLLESFLQTIYPCFEGKEGLEQALVNHVPAWLRETMEQGRRFKSHCHFVGVRCPDLLYVRPQRQFLTLDTILRSENGSEIALSYDVDFRAKIQSAFKPFDFSPLFLNDIASRDGFRLCDYCRAVRQSNFILGHLHAHVSPEVYLLLGLATGLEIPCLLMIQKDKTKDGRAFEAPSMLYGLDAFTYEHYTEISKNLAPKIQGFLQKHRNQPLCNRALRHSGAGRHEFELDAEKEETKEEADVWNSKHVDALKQALRRFTLPKKFRISSLRDADLSLWRTVWRAAPNAFFDSVPPVLAAFSQTPCNLFWLVEANKLRLAAAHPSSQELAGLSLSESLTGIVLQQKRPIIFNDTQRFWGDPSQSRLFISKFPTLKSMVTFPLLNPDSGSVISVINLLSETQLSLESKVVKGLETSCKALAEEGIRRGFFRQFPTRLPEPPARPNPATEAEPPTKAIDVTVSAFDEFVLRSPIPVVLLFGAVWAGPVKMIRPHIDALAQDYGGRARIGYVDVDDEQEIAMKYNIMSIPTILFFKEGKVVDQVVGAVPKSTLAAKLENLL